MQRFLVFIFGIIFSLSIFSQKVYIYDGETISANNIVAVFDGKYLYATDKNIIIATLKDNTLYMGKSTNSADAIVTLRGNNIYHKVSKNSNDIMYNIQNNVLYRGKFSNPKDVIGVYHYNRWYIGSSILSSRIFYTFSGKLPWLIIYMFI